MTSYKTTLVVLCLSILLSRTRDRPFECTPPKQHFLRCFFLRLIFCLFLFCILFSIWRSVFKWYLNSLSLVRESKIERQRTRSVVALRHTAIHCNTLRHTATHCNTLQHTAKIERQRARSVVWYDVMCIVVAVVVVVVFSS